jgi:hypothetical protein
MLDHCCSPPVLRPARIADSIVNGILRGDQSARDSHPFDVHSAKTVRNPEMYFENPALRCLAAGGAAGSIRNFRLIPPLMSVNAVAAPARGRDATGWGFA